MRVVIDSQRCTGHGRCYTLAPMVFSDDERGYGQVIGAAEVPPEHEETARRAIGACPEHAITLAE
jgi:ferredoxin